MKKHLAKIRLFWKSFHKLNWEAKLGIWFLIPPVCGVLDFILNILAGFESDDDLAYCFSRSWITDDIEMTFYLGLMAIVGAYLIKGNLPNKKE